MFISRKIPLLIILATALSSQVYSAELSQKTTLKKHTFGAHLAAGGVEYKNSNSDNDGVGQIYTYYNYAFTENVFLELGFNAGSDSSSWECHETANDDWLCSSNNDSLFGLAVDEVNYSNFVVAAKGTLPLSQRNSLYAKVGAQYYDYDINRRNKNIIHDSDIGLYLAAGWQYQWDMGIGMDVGYEMFDMGDLDTYTLNVGMSYQF